MEDSIILQLKKLRTIKPEMGWSANTRRVVLASHVVTPQPTLRVPFLRFLWVATPIVALGVLAIIILPSFSQVDQGSLSSGGALNLQAIAQELKGLSIHVQIKEIQYKETGDTAVAAALSEITDTATQHLSPSLLKSEETNLLNLTSPKNASIDTMLDTVIF